MCGSKLFKAPEIKLPDPVALPPPAAPRADPLVSPEADPRNPRGAKGVTRRSLKTSLAIAPVNTGAGLSVTP